MPLSGLSFRVCRLKIRLRYRRRRLSCPCLIERRRSTWALEHLPRGTQADETNRFVSIRLRYRGGAGVKACGLIKTTAKSAFFRLCRQGRIDSFDWRVQGSLYLECPFAGYT